MSNYQAVAVVTATLRYLLHEAVKNALPEAQVTLKRPEEDGGGADRDRPRINLFLFQTLDSPTARNSDLPTRNPGGGLTRRPRVALNLNYLLTFFGDAENSHLLLGLATTALHQHAFLTPQDIQDATSSKPSLQGSGLDQQQPPVRVAPLTFSFDEFSKFWSGFFQIPYSLSVAYQASVVLMDSPIEPVATLPVRQVGSRGVPRPTPRLGPLAPVSFPASGAPPTIDVEGDGLVRGDMLEVGGTLLTIGAGPSGGLSVTLPATLSPGPHPVRVGITVSLGNPPTPHTVLSSTERELKVRPTIATISFNAATPAVVFPPSPGAPATITVQVVPPLRAGQVATLSLFPTATSPGAGAKSLVLDGATQETPGVLSIAVPANVTGTFFARLGVDGVDSELGVDSSGRFTGPEVTIP
ncbi:MAG: DUF4255 domain-containing protein [Myxococcota bacterium]